MMLRTMRKGEEEAVARVAHAAFRLGMAVQGESDHAYWQRYYEENPHATNGETIVADENGKIVGAATVLRFEMSFGGIDVPMRGFAAVVVPPEARRRKIADMIMREGLGRLREQGEALSMLHPFRMSFYRKFGFGGVEATDLVRASPRQLPDSPHRARVRPWNESTDFPQLQALYDENRKHDVHRIGALTRTDYWWRKRVLFRKPDVVVFDDEKGATRGYAIYTVPKTPEYPAQECHVDELVATTPEAARGLYGYFRAMEDQYRVIQFVMPRGHSLAMLVEQGLVDVMPLAHCHPLAFAQTVNMARLIDVPKAFAIHPLPARLDVHAEVGIDVHDPLENNLLSYDVEFDAGARAKPGNACRERVSLSADRLAQIFFGAARATDLLASGFIEGDSRAAATLDRALFGLVTFVGHLNHF